MAYSDTDPFATPEVAATAGGAPPTAATQDNVSASWDSALENPKMRAALLQFGLNLMTPANTGQSTMGRIANAIGGAGEAVARSDAQDEAKRKLDISERESDSKAEYRVAQTENAGLRLQNQQKDVESKASLRQANILVANARVQQLESAADLASAKAAAQPTPENVAAAAAAKIARDQARTELDLRRAELAPQETAIRQQRADATTSNAGTNARNADTRAAREDNITTRGEGSNALRRNEQMVKMQTEYRKAMEAIDKQNENILNRNKPKLERPSFDQFWTQNNPELHKRIFPDRYNGTTTTAPTTTAPAATTQAPVAPAPSATTSPTINAEQEAAQAKAAIAKNPANADAIRQRYKQRTGRDLP